jgi:predicted transcriptional regulator
MRLADYLSEKNLTHAAFASQIGTTQAAVTRYVSGTRVPRRTLLRRIVRMTEGAVTANDFMESPSFPFRADAGTKSPRGETA